MIRPRNPNSGVATVASVTLQKLVVPLQALNIDEKELTLLKEIVLFNPGQHSIHDITYDGTSALLISSDIRLVLMRLYMLGFTCQNVF